MSDSGEPRRRVVVGVTGATGAIYAVRLLERLRAAGRETHLVATPPGILSVHHELGLDRHALEALADVSYSHADVGAAIASGSFAVESMVVAPCSMKSLGSIAHALCDNLLTRAADVCLKERRKLVLMVRETPLHLAHLRNMAAAAELGAVIFPPLPAFYHRPQTIDEIVGDSVERVLAMLGVESAQPRAWQGL